MAHYKGKPGTLAFHAENSLPLFACCGHCKHYRELNPRELVHRCGGWGAPLTVIEPRLRCVRCSRKQAKILSHPPPNSTPDDQRIYRMQWRTTGK